MGEGERRAGGGELFWRKVPLPRFQGFRLVGRRHAGSPSRWGMGEDIAVCRDGKRLSYEITALFYGLQPVEGARRPKQETTRYVGGFLFFLYGVFPSPYRAVAASGAGSGPYFPPPRGAAVESRTIRWCLNSTRVMLRPDDSPDIFA